MKTKLLVLGAIASLVPLVLDKPGYLQYYSPPIPEAKAVKVEPVVNKICDSLKDKILQNIGRQCA